ncbi:thioredoxin domain-containing protein [Candidatus Saccharibacteria bacterium]|nr:thioredoxin domain-containing protein [Candidatus Saccharibacteria bacterium]
MKKGFSAVGIVVGIIVFALIGLGAWVVIDGNNKATNFNDYDFYTVIEPTKDNGNIGDHVKGDKQAPVLIFEYADYQCQGCAAYNPRINKFVEEMDGKVAVIYRSFLLPYHQNATAAASAAEAAGLQGYWKEYTDELFSNQAEWYSASKSKRTELFEKYFEVATDGEGDMEKFRTDISSEEVSKKIKFDQGIAKRVDVQGTPAFYVDGQWINFSEAGSVTVNGKTIAWEEGRVGDDFVELLKEIVEAKSQ